MSFELIALLIIGVAFIVFGIFVLFLPEVKERQGVVTTQAKKQRGHSQKKAFWLWFVQPQRIAYTASTIGLTVFLATALILTSIPKASSSVDSSSGTPTSSEVITSGSSQTSSSIGSSVTTSSTPSSQPTGSVLTEGVLPNWDLSNPTISLDSEYGFNHTIDFVNYSPVTNRETYTVWGYEEYPNIPSSTLENFEFDFQIVNFSALRFEVYNFFTGVEVFSYEFDPGQAYRDAYLADNRFQTQEFMSLAYDGEETILVYIQPSFTTLGSFERTYEKAGAYETMLAHLNNEPGSDNHSFLLKFNVNESSTYTVLDHFSTANDRAKTNFGTFFFDDGVYFIDGLSGSMIQNNFTFMTQYLNTNNVTGTLGFRSFLVQFTMSANDTLAVIDLLLAPQDINTAMFGFKKGLQFRMSDDELRPYTTVNDYSNVTSRTELEQYIDSFVPTAVTQSYYDEVRPLLLGEMDDVDTFVNEHFPDAWPTLSITIQFMGFLTIQDGINGDFQLDDPIVAMYVSYRDFTVGTTYLNYELFQQKLYQPDDSASFVSTYRTRTYLESPTLLTQKDYIRGSVESSTVELALQNDNTGVLTPVLTNLEDGIQLTEIMVYENGYYAQGYIRNDNEDIDAILIAFDTNFNETQRIQIGGSDLDRGLYFATSPQGDPVWVINSFSTDGDFQPVAIDLPTGSSQNYWVSFNRAS